MVEEPHAETLRQPGGPGLRASKLDWSIVVGTLFVLAGWVPVGLLQDWPNSGYFGPLQIPAIWAMVGVLFAVIAVLRALDLGDRRLRMAGMAVAGVGLVRLFVMPLL